MTRTCRASLFLGVIVFHEWLQRFQDVGMDKAFASKHTTQPKIHLYSKPRTKPDGMWPLCVIRQDQVSFVELSRPMKGMLTRRSHTKPLRSGSTLANLQIGAKYSPIRVS